MILRRFILRIWAKYQLKSFQKKFQNPIWEYEKTWKYIQSITQNEDLKKLKSFYEIRQLPLLDYANYQEIFKESLQSKINPLNGEAVHFWATSTGSSGDPKLFPISKSVDWSHQVASKFRVASLINAFNIYSEAPELIFVMPGEKVDFAPNLPIGQIGYYLYKFAMPRWLESKFTFTKELYSTKESFNDWHVLFSVLQDCSGITTSIPSRISHFLNQINTNREKISEVLKSGNWPKHLGHPTTKNRIDFVLKVLEKEVKNPKDLWPSLQFLCVWKAGQTCQNQLNELLKKYNFKDIQIIDQFYNSSEGLISIPLINSNGGPCNIFGILLEFYHQETEEFYWPWELKEGELYELILTNTMGLTRYKMNDMVLCTGHFENTACLEYYSRSIPEISLGWGNISEEQLEQILDALHFKKRSEIYFQLNEKGNGLTLVSPNPIHEETTLEVETLLRKNNSNYDKQILEQNFSPLIFSLVSIQEYNAVMLENANNKRLIVFSNHQ